MDEMEMFLGELADLFLKYKAIMSCGKGRYLDGEPVYIEVYVPDGKGKFDATYLTEDESDIDFKDIKRVLREYMYNE